MGLDRLVALLRLLLLLGGFLDAGDGLALAESNVMIKGMSLFGFGLWP